MLSFWYQMAMKCLGQYFPEGREFILWTFCSDCFVIMCMLAHLSVAPSCFHFLGDFCKSNEHMQNSRNFEDWLNKEFLRSGISIMFCMWLFESDSKRVWEPKRAPVEYLIVINGIDKKDAIVLIVEKMAWNSSVLISYFHLASQHLLSGK